MALGKRTKWIIVSAGAALLAFVAVGAYVVWSQVHGTERLRGSRSTVPERAVAPAAVVKGEADWSCWRGPTLNGKSRSTGIRTDWAGGVRKLWEVDFLCQGAGSVTWSAPVVQGNRLVVPGRDEINDLVLCLDPDTGHLLWRGSYEAKAGTAHGPGARATPCIDDDRVYTFGRSGHLACWRLSDGQRLWLKSVAEVGGQEPDWGHSASPLVVGDKVVVQAGGSAFAVAYHKLTGEVAWKSPAGPAGYAALSRLQLGDAPALLVFHGTGLAMLDPADGRVLGAFPWKTSYHVNACTPAVEGTTVFITSGYNTGCAALRASREKGLEVLWKNRAIAAQHSDPIIVDGFVYGYSGPSTQNGGTFKCVELSTGQERWRTNEIGWGTALGIDGHLLCLDIRGNLYLVKPDPRGFRKVTEFKGALGEVKDPAWTIPVAANGKLYLRHMQRLICYSLLP